MTGCYLTSLPFEFMRAVADFDPEWSGSYFVPRATVRPPASLLVQVWPELDKWKLAHDCPESNEAINLDVEFNMAAGAFLELLEWLREVLLQDAVFLREYYPNHPIFQESVFRCSEFEAFAGRVKDACRSSQGNSHVAAIQKAAPIVAAGLRTVAAQQVAAEQLAERRHAELVAANQTLATKVDDLMGSQFTITWSPGRSRAIQQWEVRAPHDTVVRPVDPAPPIQTVIMPERGQGTQEVSQSVSERQATQEVGQAIPGRQATQEVGQAIPGRSQAPSYMLPRNIQTVQDLLRLWRYGLGGMPSIDSLERDWGSRWRPTSEKNYFSTRKTVVDEVVRRAVAQNIQEDVVAKRMDVERGSKSLDKLIKSIKLDRKS